MKCSYIVIHHSATEPDTSVEDIRAAHRARGFIDIGYHYLIHPDGSVAVGRPEHQQGAHARGLNDRSIGVCCIGNFETTNPDPRQIQVLTELVVLLAKRYAVAPHRIIGHRDVVRISSAATVTVCPGLHLAPHIPAIRSKTLSSMLTERGYKSCTSLYATGEGQKPTEVPLSYASTCDQAALIYLVRSLSNLERRYFDGIHPLDLFALLRASDLKVTVLYQELEEATQVRGVIANLESLGVAHKLIHEQHAEELSASTLCLIQGYEHALGTIGQIRDILPRTRIGIHANTLGWLRWREARALGTADTNDSEAATDKAIELSAYTLVDEVWVSSTYEHTSLQIELPQVKTRTIGHLCDLTASIQHDLGGRILFPADFTPQNQGQDAGWLEELLIQLRSRNPHSVPLDIACEGAPESIMRLANNTGVSITPACEQSQPLPRLVIAPIWPGVPQTRDLRRLIERGFPLITNTHGNARLGLRHGQEILVADTADDVVELLTQVQRGVFNLHQLRQRALEQISSQCNRHVISRLLLAALVPPRVVIALQLRGDGRYLDRSLRSLSERTLYPHYQVIIFGKEAYKSDLQPSLQTYKRISIADQAFTPTPHEIVRYITARYPNDDIVLMQDDLVVQQHHWLHHLVDCAYSAAYVSASCGMIVDSKKRIVEAGAEMNLAGYSNPLAHSKPAYSPEAASLRAVGFGSSSLLYVRRDALEILGNFEPSSSSALHAVAAWQYRAHASGWSTRYTPLCIATTLASEFSFVETPKDTLDRGGFLSPISGTSFEEFNG